MGEYRISIVPPGLIEFIWDEVYPVFIRSVSKEPDNMYDDPNSYLSELLANNFQLVVITQGQDIVGALILRVIYENNQKLLLGGSLAGDDFKEWRDTLLEFLIAKTRQENCQAYRMYALRPGWDKILNKYGFQRGATPYTLEVN